MECTSSLTEITACIITRFADQSTLVKALESIARCVDGVNVCCTDVATFALPQFDVPIHFSYFPWNDSFSAARNKSLEDVTTDWIMYIDSDDEVINAGAIRLTIARCPEYMDAIAVMIRSKYADGSFVENWQPRIFRRGLLFKGRVHEQLYDPADPGRETTMWGQPEVRIEHHGYLCDEATKAAREARNSRLMLADMQDDPDDYMIPMHYARQEMGINNPVALEMATRAFEAWQRKGAYAVSVGALLYTTLMQALVSNQLWERAIALNKDCPSQYQSAELWFLTGTALIQAGQIDEGIKCFQAAHDDTSVLRDIGGDAEVWTWKPLMALSQIYAALADQERR